MKKCSNKQSDAFESAKAFAHFENCWEGCLHGECKKRKRCTGGPRGTWRKFGGVPFCRLEVNCETSVQPGSGTIKSDVPRDEEPPKHV